jgi:hypothetical protein
MSSAVLSYSRWTSSNVMPPARLPTTTVFSSAFLRAGNAVSSSRPQKAGKSKLQRMRDEQISKTSCTWPGVAGARACRHTHPCEPGKGLLQVQLSG